METGLFSLLLSNWFLILVAIVALVFIGTFLQDVNNTYLKGMPPGPLSLPVIGGLYRLSPSQPHIAMEKLIKTYGKIFTLQFGFLGTMVFVCDPGLPYKIVSNKIADRPPFPVFKYLNGEEEGIGSDRYSPRLKQLRVMSYQAISCIGKASLYQHTNKAFQLFFTKAASHQGRPFDPTEDITNMTVALLTSFIYGIDYETFDDPILAKMKHNRDVTISVLNPAHPFNLIPWTINIPCKWSRELKSSVKDRDEVLDDQYKRLESDGPRNNMLDTVLSKMADLRKKLHGDNKPGIEATKISCWTLDNAGASTMFNTIQWLVLYLAKHQEVQQRAFQDINRQVPTQQLPTLADRVNLPYIDAIVLEVLRIAPPVPMGIPRTCLDAGVDIGQYHLPKGTMVLVNIWHIHHNEKYWSDPDKFLPERFLDSDTGQCIPSHKLPYFLPFGHGKRSCVGLTLARHILFLYTCALVKCMDIKGVDPEDIDLRGTVTLGLEPFPHKIFMEARENVDMDQLFQCVK